MKCDAFMNDVMYALRPGTCPEIVIAVGDQFLDVDCVSNAQDDEDTIVVEVHQPKPVKPEPVKPKRVKKAPRTLRELDAAARAIRFRRKINNPGAELYLGCECDETIVVKADGYGGAVLRVYADDSAYFRSAGVSKEQFFDTELSALEAADKLRS